MIESAPQEYIDLVWEKVWRDKVEVNGVLDKEEVKKRLYDYGVLIHRTGSIYEYITDGAITAPFASLEDVAYHADSFTVQAVDSGIADIMSVILDILNEEGSSDQDKLKNIEEVASVAFTEKAQ